MDLDFLDNKNNKNNKGAFDGLLDFSNDNKKSLHQLSQQPQQQQQQPVANDTNWTGLDMLNDMGSSSNTTRTTAQPIQSNDLLGDDTLIDSFDDFGLLDASKKPAASPQPSQTQPTNQTDDFDILGDLAKPVQQRPQHQNPPAATKVPKPTHRSSSPPPHLVGQLVEMGFSPLDATQALKSSNMDLSAAATMLISQSQEPSSGAAPQERPSSQQRQRPARETRETPKQPQPDAAEELIQQASALGNDLFSKASSYWSVGKTMAQKAFEEQRQRVGKQQTEEERLRREKEKREYEERKSRWDQGASSGFRDDDVPVQESGSFVPPQLRQADRPASTRPSLQASREPSRQSSQQSGGSLLDAFKPSSYVSPARHAVRSRAATPTQQQTSSPKPAPKPKKARVNPPVSQAALDQSGALRAQGNEAFKLGSYAQAVALYEQAASSIPPNHIRSAVVNANLATTHLKNGDADSAIKSATAAVSIIGDDYDPSEGINVLETAAKAYKSRASAHELNERHADAQKDYEKLISISTKLANIQNQAIEGLRRAKAAQEPKKSTSTPIATSNASIKAAGEKAAKAALERSKAASLQEAAEDTERHALKDGVDAQLLRWKAGKVDNIRALLSSVDTILWPELGLKKFGMHELVTDVSVKKVYMRTVSKVHPDKINAKTSTLEQRMIAQGVFATLNEAYNKQR
ncbi:hypothetical protein E3P99_02257 [Wallemia hederae]|uniref:UBA domain-containing protein n=1 Tax=Wallemia hederae TaxID=1540922 RepID=A0A4T0FL80_9BASI|nr:hypothetical protein E3P99_02257 [Wallemia hederae]